MAKYRKKPIVIEAWQSFDGAGTHTEIWPQWIIDALRDGTIYADGDQTKIRTLEGDQHVVSNGDWIIRGIKGELYACKPDIFEQTYEQVKE